MSDAKIEVRYHWAMPGRIKLVGLKIYKVPECEGGGHMFDEEQLRAILKPELFEPEKDSEQPGRTG